MVLNNNNHTLETFELLSKLDILNCDEKSFIKTNIEKNNKIKHIEKWNLLYTPERVKKIEQFINKHS